MKDAMHQDRIVLDDVEDEIVVYRKVTVSEAGEFFFTGNSAESGMIREPGKSLLDLISKFFGSGKPVLRNIGDDLGKIVFRDTEDFDRILMRAHAVSF